jgi:tyrosyl-tRNA synthetase
MLRYYELLTTEDLDDVRAAHPMEAKQRLAELMVARYHGSEAAKHARAAFQQTFQEREFPNEPDVHLVLSKADLREDGTIGLPELIAKTGLVSSKSEARRLIVQGGLEINGQKRTDVNGVLTVTSGKLYRMKVGRRKFALIESKV